MRRIAGAPDATAKVVDRALRQPAALGLVEPAEVDGAVGPPDPQ
jgi:hypothetical protein